MLCLHRLKQDWLVTNMPHVYIQICLIPSVGTFGSDIVITLILSLTVCLEIPFGLSKTYKISVITLCFHLLLDQKQIFEMILLRRLS